MKDDVGGGGVDEFVFKWVCDTMGALLLGAWWTKPEIGVLVKWNGLCWGEWWECVCCCCWLKWTLLLFEGVDVDELEAVDDEDDVDVEEGKLEYKFELNGDIFEWLLIFMLLWDELVDDDVDDEWFALLPLLEFGWTFSRLRHLARLFWNQTCTLASVKSIFIANSSL